MKKIPELSLFFPVYNEEANIAKTVKKAQDVLNKIARRYEIIIIDDGSKDKTDQIADGLAKDDERIKVIHHRSNKGYGEALKSGFYNSKYAWIVTTDADGQFDFSEVRFFLDKMDQAEVIIGYRLERQDSLLRKVNGWAWTFLNNLLFGLSVHDVDCSFKLVKKEVLDVIPRLESGRGGMISPELLAKAKKSGFRITEVGIHHFPRIAGKQTGANLKVILKSFLDLFRLWKTIRFQKAWKK